MSETTTTLGTEFAHALADKDERRIRELLHPEIDFRALTPSRFWEASDPDGVIAIAFENWFDESDEIRSLEHVETDTVVDRERVGYRLSVSNPDGDHLVEQQAYLYGVDGRIKWLRLLCVGYRPV